MRYFRLASAFITLSVLGVAASAQQPNSGLTPQAGVAPALSGKGKIAVINTGAFQEQVGEFKAKIDALNRQFEPRVKEVTGLADKITALETTIKTQSSTLTPARIAEMAEQLDNMKRDYQRKKEDLQAEAGRARDKAFEPVQAKLVKFAQQYTASRGITLLLDLANSIQSQTLVWYDPRTDVTKDFIAEYNKANPAAAAATPAPPKPE